MTRFVLLATLAAASAVVGSAEIPLRGLRALADPAQVATNWNQTVEEACKPLLTPGPLGLQAEPPKPLSANPTIPVHTSRPKFNGDVLQVPSLPPGYQLDPGFVHGNQSEEPPPDAKPWYYRGQKFWIVPIAADATRGISGGK